jgi:hypothetical protein
MAAVFLKMLLKPMTTILVYAFSIAIGIALIRILLVATRSGRRPDPGSYTDPSSYTPADGSAPETSGHHGHGHGDSGGSGFDGGGHGGGDCGGGGCDGGGGGGH